MRNNGRLFNSHRAVWGLVLSAALVATACGTAEEAVTVAPPTATVAPTVDEIEIFDVDAARALGFGDDVAWSFLRDLSDVELNVMIHPSFYAGIGGETGLFEEFQRLSGAKVKVVTAPAGESYTLQMVEWSRESDTFDVVFPLYGDTAPNYLQHLEPLDDLIAGAPAEWEYENLIPGVQALLEWDGVTRAMVFRWGIEGYVYRADLLKEAGVEVPTTFEEIDIAARAVHAATGRYGWVLRGVGAEIVQDWLSLYATTGGTLYKEDGRTCNVNTTNAIQVLETVVSWINDGVMAPDTLAIGRGDSVTLIQQDRAAQGFYFGGRWPLLIGNDSLDVVRENLAWPAKHPGELSRNTPQSVAISKYSKNKDAAWALIEYILHPSNTHRHVTEYSGTLNRLTDLDNPTVQADFKIYEYFLEAAATSYVEPSSENSNQVFSIMNEELTAAILGTKSSAAALRSACQRMDALK